MSEQCIYLELFQKLRMHVGDAAPIEFPKQQTGALLAYLALHRDKAHTREQLIDIFWPDSDQEEGRQSLRQQLYLLRGQLAKTPFNKDDILRSTRTTIQLNPEMVRTDASEFEEMLHTSEHTSDLSESIRLLARAITLYTGELLPGFYQDEFIAERNRLEVAYQNALHRLTRAYEQNGDLNRAIETAQRAVRTDPLMEEAHCALMRLHIAAGQPSAAVRQFQTLKHILRDELDSEPSEMANSLLAVAQTSKKAHPVPANENLSIKPMPAISPSPLVEETVPAESYTLTYLEDAPIKKLSVLQWFPAALLLIFACTLLLAWKMYSKPLKPANRSKGEMLWITRWQSLPGGTVYKDSEPTAIETDAAGNIYVCGFVQTSTHDTDAITLKYDPNGKLLWQHLYNGPANDCERARSLALDSAGNVYVVCESYNGEQSKDGTEWDVALIKYDSQGKEIWVRRYDDSAHNDELPAKVVVDTSGRIYVACITWRDLKQHSCDFTLLQYASDGALRWIRRYNSYPTPDKSEVTVPKDMVVDRAGNACITGYGVFYNDARTGEDFDYLTVKYDADGKRLWERHFNGLANGNDYAYKLALDGAGNVLVTGQCNNGNSLNGGTGENITTVKYDAKGVLRWTRSFTATPQWSSPNTLAADAEGNVTVGGIMPATRFKDWVVIQYDANGNQNWTASYNGKSSRDDGLTGMTVDREGNVIVTGIAYNGSPSQGNSGNDIMTIKYDLHGVALWGHAFNGPVSSDDAGAVVTVDRAGNILVAGQSRGQTTADIVVLKYSP